MKSKLLIASEWLWSTRGRNLWLHPNTLTEANAQDKTAPRLSLVEAIGVFRYLEDHKLIFPMRATNGQTVYCLHEVKEREWEEVLSELRKPKWMRSKVLKTAGKLSIGFLSLVIAGFLGGYSRKVADDFYDSRKPKPTGSNIVSQAVSERVAAQTNQNQSSPPTSTPNNITNK